MIEAAYIWLRRDGDDAVVEVVTSDGRVREVIREFVGGDCPPFSHCWHNNNDGRPSTLAKPAGGGA